MVAFYTLLSSREQCGFIGDLIRCLRGFADIHSLLRSTGKCRPFPLAISAIRAAATGGKCGFSLLWR
jgi:hypothetical protein